MSRVVISILSRMGSGTTLFCAKFIEHFMIIVAVRAVVISHGDQKQLRTCLLGRFKSQFYGSIVVFSKHALPANLNDGHRKWSHGYMCLAVDEIEIILVLYKTTSLCVIAQITTPM